MKNLLLLISLVSILTSCKKDEEPPVLIISPSQLHIVGSIDQLISFGVKVNATAKLSKVIIKAQPENEMPFTLLDTNISTKGTSFIYYYRIPEKIAGKSTTFSFRAEDNNGLSNEDYRVLFVNPKNAVQPLALTETAGHRMYRFRSTHFDAYNLKNNNGEFSLTADSTVRDIQDFSDTTNATLSGSWKSPAGGKFVLFVSGSGFDYANATDSTAIGAYNAGLKQSLLYNLKAGDVIITKLGSSNANKYVVMRLTNTVDAADKDDDYYEFSIKK